MISGWNTTGAGSAKGYEQDASRPSALADQATRPPEGMVTDGANKTIACQWRRPTPVLVGGSGGQMQQRGQAGVGRAARHPPCVAKPCCKKAAPQQRPEADVNEAKATQNVHGRTRPLPQHEAEMSGLPAAQLSKTRVGTAWHTLGPPRPVLQLHNDFAGDVLGRYWDRTGVVLSAWLCNNASWCLDTVMFRALTHSVVAICFAHSFTTHGRGMHKMS